MSDSRTFKKGEAVILYDGSRKRTAVELGEVGKDCSYIETEVLITFGAFNTRWDKLSVHKLPATLKAQLKGKE